MREKFDDRHAGITILVTHNYRGGDERDLSITYSRLPLPGDHPYRPTGRIGEIWVNTINEHEKLINDDMRDTCATTSRDLQNGDTVEKLSRSVLRDSRGKPLGWLGTVLDALKKEPIDA